MGNPNTCLKVSPRQIQKIVFRAAEMQDRAPEFLDLLGMVVKVTGTDLTLKRNQAYVMKYIMQNYKKVAYVLDLALEDKYVDMHEWTLFCIAMHDRYVEIIIFLVFQSKLVSNYIIAVYTWFLVIFLVTENPF